MSVLSEHLGFGNFEEAYFQTYPNMVLWIRRADGKLIGFTYYRAQEVLAWHQHTIAGTDAKVKSLAVIPGVGDAFKGPESAYTYTDNNGNTEPITVQTTNQKLEELRNELKIII